MYWPNCRRLLLYFALLLLLSLAFGSRRGRQVRLNDVGSLSTAAASYAADGIAGWDINTAPAVDAPGNGGATNSWTAQLVFGLEALGDGRHLIDEGDVVLDAFAGEMLLAGGGRGSSRCRRSIALAAALVIVGRGAGARHNSRPDERLAADHVVVVVLLNGVLGVGEAVEGVKHVLEDLDVDVAGPEEVEVLVVRDLGGYGLSRQLAQHGLDVDQRVAAAVHEHHGRADIARRVLGYLGELARRADAHRLVHVVVVQLEALVANDLEPVHH